MPIRDLHLDGDGPAYQQIYRSIRCAILSGRAGAGLRLPSSRWLADDLGVSRTTVLAAYDQLTAEGYAEARVGSGTYVAPQLPGAAIERRSLERQRPHLVEAPAAPRLSRYGERVAAADMRAPYDSMLGREPLRFDFMPCVPDLAGLSSESWRRCVARTAARTDESLFGYGDPSGTLSLRRAVATYLGRSRGVICEPDDVLVVSGVAQALDLSLRILVDEGDAVLLEEPHYVGAGRACAAAGARTVALPTDADGADIDAAPPELRDACRVAYVTPSHQFPTGAVLSLSRRMALLDWARRVDAYLLEDDYDSEFRYAGRSIEALKSLDEDGRVIYVGTFSKVLYPGLRLAYLVLPPALRPVFRQAHWLNAWASPTLEQEALAAFIESGDFERHLRRARTLYGRRRRALLEALDSTFGVRARYADSRAGLHVMIELRELPASRSRDLLRRALEADVAVYGTEFFYQRPPEHCQLMLGFTLLDESEIAEGIARLAAVVDELAAVPATASATGS